MPVLFSAVGPPWVATWLTPMWLIGLGVTLGLLVLLLVWGVVFLINPRAGKLVPLGVSEGPLLPIFIGAMLLVLFAIFGTLIVRKPGELFESFAQLPTTGTDVHQFEIPGIENYNPETSKPEVVEVAWNQFELKRLVIESPVDVRISNIEEILTETTPTREIRGEVPDIWDRRESDEMPFLADEVDKIYVWNKHDQPIELTVSITTQPKHAEVIAIPIAAGVVILVFLLYFAQRAFLPKIAAISLATSKSEMAQPLFLICMGLGFFFLTVFMVLPYNTFGEDIKMVKDSGLTLIMVLSILACLWAASNSISEEIEGRTALTVMSKPIGRQHFILGKFTGISWVAIVMFLLLGTYFLLLLCYKPIYDARESAAGDATWEITFREMAQTTPGLLLALFETLILAAISIAVSTRLPMLANFIICVSIYALGHLTPMIVKSSMGDFAPVEFVARLIATVLPVLEHFDMKPAIAGDQIVPWTYMGTSFLYCVLYSTVALLLALILFEDRDLA